MDSVDVCTLDTLITTITTHIFAQNSGSGDFHADNDRTDNTLPLCACARGKTCVCVYVHVYAWVEEI